MGLEIRRGHHQKESVGSLAHGVDVAGKVYAGGVEHAVGEISGVVAQPLEVVDAVVAAHIPKYGVAIL